MIWESKEKKGKIGDAGGQSRLLPIFSLVSGPRPLCRDRVRNDEHHSARQLTRQASSASNSVHDMLVCARATKTLCAAKSVRA